MPSDPEKPSSEGSRSELSPRDLEAEMLTDQEKEKVRRLEENGSVGHQEALLRVVSREKARRIIGFQNAHWAYEDARRAAEARRMREQKPAVDINEALRLMRETDPDRKPSDETEPPAAA